MTTIIAYREQTWMDAKADFRQWDHLARAYGVDLILLDRQQEVGFHESVMVIVDELGDVELADFSHPDECTYLFGRTGQNLIELKHDYSVRIATPNEISLFGCEAAAIVLQDRESKK